jgi:SRSO17 transposase
MLKFGHAGDRTAIHFLDNITVAQPCFACPRARLQSLHHVVADAPWSDEVVLDRCLDFVIPEMLRRDPVVAWVVDDTGFPKQGHESVGVARQYCGQVGKQDNCRVVVSLSVTTEAVSMPVAFRLYLPESWAQDRKRRKKTGVPESIDSDEARHCSGSDPARA